MKQPILYSLLTGLLLLSGCATTDKPAATEKPAVIDKPAPAEKPTTKKSSDQQKQRWLSWHQGWVGTPHRLGGNSRRGIDCSAYVQRGYRKLYGIELPRTTRAQRKRGKAIGYNRLQAGDLVFFRPDTYPNHVGIYLGDGTFIHVSSKKGVVRSSLEKGYWRRHFRQGRRIQ
ncbi:MAG TPA: hypothetical protein EYH06_07310 [Chromatiales bacterium]|nr:hypothetical protein [Thiotrichales bacterium]HIP68383.1 hypothetical protein [Chromatiales bacterium]